MKTKRLIKKLTIPTEYQEQNALVKWLNFHPTVRDFFCKNNNEGKRSAIQGYNLKLNGLRPGVSDLFIYYPANGFHGLWLEVKRNKIYTKSEMSTLTWMAQEEFMRNVRSVGYAASFCFGWENGKNIVENYLRS